MTLAATKLEEEEKEFVSLYVPKSIAKAVKDLKNGEALQEELIAYVEKTRRGFRAEISTLDEDVLLYKAQVFKAKEALKAAYEEYTDENYKLWEAVTEKVKTSKDFTELAVATLAPLKKELDEINTLMRSVSTWEIEKLIGLLHSLATADSDTREMLRFLFANYSQPSK